MSLYRRTEKRDLIPVIYMRFHPVQGWQFDDSERQAELLTFVFPDGHPFTTRELYEQLQISIDFTRVRKTCPRRKLLHSGIKQELQFHISSLVSSGYLELLTQK